MIVRGRFLTEDKPKFRKTHLQGRDVIYFHNIIHKRKSFGKNFLPGGKKIGNHSGCLPGPDKNPLKKPGGFKSEVLMPEKIGEESKTDSTQVGKQLPVDEGKRHF